MTYARSRLWLGISGVGLLVVIASTALSLGLPRRMLSGLSDLAAISVTLLCFVCISIPSDVLGGYCLPRQHNRTEIRLKTFFLGWIRGVLSQAFILGLCATIILRAGRWGGEGAGIICFTLLMLLLLAAQALVARIVGNFSKVSQDRVRDLDREQSGQTPPSSILLSADPGFVGGLVGFPTAERLIVPGAWSRNLAPDMLATELTRRKGAIATGSRTRGLLVAIAWNLVGFALAIRMPGASVRDASGLVQSALWFTLWSFVGLLTLPSINRPGVIEADRFALRSGVSPEMLRATISCLDHLQDDEPSRGRWIERIFHPIPSVEQRVAALSDVRSDIGAWQCARVTLYLSWACFGFLSRAVHCNAGRPDLWVLFPGD